MTALSLIEEAVREWSAPQVAGDYIVIPTFSSYPSNSLVQAFVSGDKNHFVVSDGGGAMKTFISAGGAQSAVERLLKDFMKSAIVRVDAMGWLYISGVPIQLLTSAISIVTEASLDAARYLMKRFHPVPVVDFRKDLEVVLKSAFLSGLQRRGHLVGASNKMHTFDYVVSTNDNILIAVDAVVRDASSINAAVVAHFDVKETKRTDVRQFIVYDDGDDWSSADLALLSIGAPSIGFSGFQKTVVEKYIAV